MKIFELVENLKARAQTPVDAEKTCDTIKIGSDQKEICGVGVTMFATPNVIRAAAEKGCNFLIVHEPLCYDHMDQKVPSPIGYEKKKLLEEYGITVFRFHDYAHSMHPDLIFEGQIQAMGLSGKRMERPHYAVGRFLLDTPMTARELADHLQKVWDIDHIQLTGCPDKKGALLSCAFGTPGHIMSEMEACDFVLTGELCQWREAEAARDWAQLGYNKAVLVLGHIGSERQGMKLLAKMLQKEFSEFKTHYIECGEVYL